MDFFRSFRTGRIEMSNQVLYGDPTTATVQSRWTIMSGWCRELWIRTCCFYLRYLKRGKEDKQRAPDPKCHKGVSVDGGPRYRCERDLIQPEQKWSIPLYRHSFSRKSGISKTRIRQSIYIDLVPRCYPVQKGNISVMSRSELSTSTP